MCRLNITFWIQSSLTRSIGVFFKNDNFEEEKKSADEKNNTGTSWHGDIVFLSCCCSPNISKESNYYILDPKNYRNRPYANFIFAKSNVLVPILHTV